MTTAASRTRDATGSRRSAHAIGSGSATPVVSSTIASSVGLRVDEVDQRAVELVAEHAAHAAAGQLDLARGVAAEQRAIDADLAELVDDHAELARRVALGTPREQAVDQRGLAGAEKAGHEDERDSHADSIAPRLQ